MQRRGAGVISVAALGRQQCRQLAHVRPHKPLQQALPPHGAAPRVHQGVEQLDLWRQPPAQPLQHLFPHQQQGLCGGAMWGKVREQR